MCPITCPQAALSVDTPLLTVGALSKRWIVPGASHRDINATPREQNKSNIFLLAETSPSALASPLPALLARWPQQRQRGGHRRPLSPVPSGWRVGWLLVHDRHGCLAQARVSEALSRLAQISIGPTVPVQVRSAKAQTCTARTPRLTPRSLRCEAGL